MRSLLVEFHRFGDLNKGLLRAGDPYLVAVASQPVCQTAMPLDYEEFLDLMQALRYQDGDAAREEALHRVSEIVTSLLRSQGLRDLQQGEFPLQLDLVANAAELAALPFEAAVDGAGEPLIVRSERPIVLTRRVRNDFAETVVRWPAKARILFAWACPNARGVQAVPYKEHEAALRKALAPWIPLEGPSGTPPDASSVLRVLERASLDSIRAACEEAVDQKKPFTHVHLLAHGYPIGESFKQRFGLALHAPGTDYLDAVDPEALVEALAPLRGHTCVLSLAACDSANAVNTVIPRRSIAHQLHVSGIPVVIASQLPLTVPGSTILIENFYVDLLAGKDVRSALHKARCALYEHRKTAGHDWASLVGYVRLPEGYADHLPAVRLEAVLSSLKAVQAWSDDLVKSDVIDQARFERLADLLRANIQKLEVFLEEKKLPKGVLEENLGLLGSAEKRLAELYFECGRRSGGDAWREPMRAALERARSWYRKGFDSNLSHHWTGVQFLSLEAVLAGRIGEPGRWYAAALAARLDAEKPSEVWAYGSLIELHLIASAAGLGDQTAQALQAVAEMKNRVAGSAGGDRFPLESTERQMRRYAGWWMAGNGFFPGQPDLAAQAEQLAKALGTATV